MDLNKLIARVKAILMTPKTEWPVIASEPTTVADLYKGYIVPLAAVPAVFAFLQMSIFGVSVPFAGRMRLGMEAGLSTMVLTFVLALIGTFVLALIVEALAPTFAGQKDRVQALKTVAYAYTASWVASIGSILPVLGWLITIAGSIYGIYLLYLGLPHTMKNPPDKSAGYTAVTIVVAILLWFVISAIVGGIAGVGMGSFMRGASYSSSTSDGTSDEGTFDKDSPLGKLEQYAKDVEKATSNLEAAQKSGDQDAQAEALQQMMGAALGGGDVESLAPERLKPFLPDTLAGLPRSSFTTERNAALGLQISTARATYSNESGRSVNLEITDTGSAKGLLALANWSGVEGEQETERGYDKTYRADGRLIHEQWDRIDSSGEYSIVLGDRFTVKVQGQADSVDELKAALAELDLGELEALKKEGTKAN